MARRRGGILALLVEAPWWVSALVSLAGYAFVAFIIPAVLGREDRLVGTLAGQIPSLAPLVALAFLLPAPLSVFRRWRARQVLNSQTGIDSIRGLTWQQFETLVAEAYRRKGYAVEVKGGAGPDGGIDLVAAKDRRFLVQCKHWRVYRVGVREARELLGLVTAQRAAGGILITSGAFTAEAEDFSRGQPLELINGRRLLGLVRLVQGARPHTTTTQVPEAHGSNTTQAPACPTCDRPMVMRLSNRGPQAGRRFWGCSGYPSCRGTRDLAVSNAVS